MGMRGATQSEPQCQRGAPATRPCSISRLQVHAQASHLQPTARRRRHSLKHTSRRAANMAAGEVAAPCSRLPSVRPAALASPRATSAATCSAQRWQTCRQLGAKTLGCSLLLPTGCKRLGCGPHQARPMQPLLGRLAGLLLQVCRLLQRLLLQDE